MARIVVDPVTRIEGHLRVEAVVDNGVITDAFSSGTMVRGLESVDDVHPVQGMEMIKVNHVVLDILSGEHDVADDLGCGRHYDAKSVFHGAHAG